VVVSHQPKPVLYIVACGGYTAGQLDGFIQRLQQLAWDVCVIATPSALKFIDTDRLEALTGHVVRHEYKLPDEPDVLPPADAIAVVPATFNTINKWVNGISDTFALGLLNAAIGLETPVVVAPTPNAALAKHPAFMANIAILRSWGVRVLFEPERHPSPAPNTGLTATDFFSWESLEAAISEFQHPAKPASG
jgi:hypothetical protein